MNGDLLRPETQLAGLWWNRCLSWVPSWSR